MKLDLPIYRLKQQAKTLARQQHVPLYAALDQIARRYGFAQWSLLVAKVTAADAEDSLPPSHPGDVVLLAARPRQGKTRLGMSLLVAALEDGRRGVFFSLAYTDGEVLDLFEQVAGPRTQLRDRFEFDTSNNICADYVMAALQDAPPETLVVIDYLQVLDQKRSNADLQTQLQALRAYAAKRGLILVLLSQIDRSYDPQRRPFPGLADLQLPNPVDPGLFSQGWFLNDGAVRVVPIG